MTTRAEIPALVSERLDGRYVRWREPGGPAFDGAERTLEIHDAAAREHRALLRRLRDLLPRLSEAAGGPVVFVFFTPEQSARRAHAAGLLRPVLLDVDLPRHRRDVAVREGEARLPRVA